EGGDGGASLFEFFGGKFGRWLMQIICALIVRRFPFIARREAWEAREAPGHFGVRAIGGNDCLLVRRMVCASPHSGASHIPLEKRREKRAIKMADFAKLRETAKGGRDA